MDRLLREGNPPAGQLASPVPQAHDPVARDYKRVTGQQVGSDRFATDSVFWGLTNTGQYVRLRVDAQGRLILAADIQVSAGDINVGTVNQGDVISSAPWAMSEATVVSAPVTGTKTVTSTVAEIFAGASRKASRRKMVVRNLHQSVPVRVGGVSITDAIGQLLEPGASVEVNFHPNQAVPIYVVSTAGNVPVEVIEV
jgi:hypothetical protein